MPAHVTFLASLSMVLAASEDHHIRKSTIHTARGRRFWYFYGFIRIYSSDLFERGRRKTKPLAAQKKRFHCLLLLLLLCSTGLRAGTGSHPIQVGFLFVALERRSHGKTKVVARDLGVWSL